MYTRKPFKKQRKVTRKVEAGKISVMMISKINYRLYVRQSQLSIIRFTSLNCFEEDKLKQSLF